MTNKVLYSLMLVYKHYFLKNKALRKAECQARCSIMMLTNNIPPNILYDIWTILNLENYSSLHEMVTQKCSFIGAHFWFHSLLPCSHNSILLCYFFAFLLGNRMQQGNSASFAYINSAFPLKSRGSLSLILSGGSRIILSLLRRMRWSNISFRRSL